MHPAVLALASLLLAVPALAQTSLPQPSPPQPSPTQTAARGEAPDRSKFDAAARELGGLKPPGESRLAAYERAMRTAAEARDRATRDLVVSNARAKLAEAAVAPLTPGAVARVDAILGVGLPDE